MNTRPLLLSIAGLALLLASGCRTLTGGSCHKEQPYETADSRPPLRVPPGLDGPDTSGALAIPELNEPEAPLDPDGPCLDAPPALTAPPPPPSDITLPQPGAPGEGPGSGSPPPEDTASPSRRPSRPR